MCDYNSEKLYSKVRELRAKRDQLDPITFEDWIHELILIGCMITPIESYKRNHSMSPNHNWRTSVADIRHEESNADMTEVCSKRSVTGLTRKRVPRGLSGHRYPSSRTNVVEPSTLYEPRNVSIEDAMRV